MSEKKHEKEIRGDQFVEPPEGYTGSTKLIKWGPTSFAIGAAQSPFFFKILETRRNNNESNIFAVSGAPGKGKSYFALRTAQILDPKFHILDTPAPQPDQDTSQVIFDNEHLLYLLGNKSPLKPGQVIIVDEAQYAMGSRRWYEEIQKRIMETLESIRSRNFIIIIVCLHLNLLDIIVRKYVLSHLIHMEKRGVGTAYALYTPRFEKEMRKRRLGKVQLLLPDADKCNWAEPFKPSPRVSEASSSSSI